MKEHDHRIVRVVTLGVVSVCALAANGCASTPGPTRELVAARTAFNQASSGITAQEAPGRLKEAEQALEYAEWVHEEDPGSMNERQNGYIALRLSQVAMAHAGVRRAQRDVMSQRARYEAIRRVAASAEPRTEIEVCRARLSILKKSDEGVTLTLSGAVLFAFNKATLLPSAQRVLEEVAEVLRTEEQSDRNIVVVGHTDAVGSDAANQALSQARANAVRNFLVGRGVSAHRIRAVGRGENQPVAKNDSPETRAQNRRVEIVIGERKTASR